MFRPRIRAPRESTFATKPSTETSGSDRANNSHILSPLPPVFPPFPCRPLQSYDLNSNRSLNPSLLPDTRAVAPPPHVVHPPAGSPLVHELVSWTATEERSYGYTKCALDTLVIQRYQRTPTGRLWIEGRAAAAYLEMFASKRLGKVCLLGLELWDGA